MSISRRVFNTKQTKRPPSLRKIIVIQTSDIRKSIRKNQSIQYELVNHIEPWVFSIMMR